MTGRERRGPGPGRDLLPDLFSLSGTPSPARMEPVARRADAVPGEYPESALSISGLVRTAKEVLEGAFFPLWVRGEVCDLKRHRSGHWYFCLRDENSQIRCVVWSSDQFRIPAPPDEGMQVVAFGRLTVYPTRGEMQFAVTRLDAVGDGLWRKALEAAVLRLKADGLMAPERKRPLPLLPRRIAVVTSIDGAAVRDIMAVVRRRCPLVELVVCGARVQGDGAPEDLVSAIERVGRWGGADVMIVGRGGGSREDLWAFNDERVARAIAACPVPTISAVGHEVDVTLCDLVADVRAPTPSAAAETAVPVLADLQAQLEGIRTALRGALARRATLARRDLVARTRRLTTTAARMGERRRARWEQAAARLHALSPLAVLGRGYALARDEADGRTLSDASRFEPGLPFRLVLRDGVVRARAEEIEPGTPAGVEPPADSR
ncbi:MAG TPA: exodeoxyribonuclease VII large subunit [Gemmatimonadaceae bacterium]|nr:exodeoxyribonuclease VII large subunit [Gemmatimonadaceae bacterium]